MTEGRIALFIGGAHKAGTSALFERLKQHPELCGHPQSELTYFAEPREHGRGFESRAWRKYLPRGYDPARFVAKHVKLLYQREAQLRLREAAPGVELVFLLRHPVERAHSAYWHARARGRETLATFEQALAAEEQRLGAGWPPWHDAMYVQNGLYAGHLAQAFELFGRERVHVHLLEDQRQRPLEICRELYRLLGVDQGFRPDLERGLNRATRARSERLARAAGAFFESCAPWRRALRAAFPDRLAVALRQGFVRWNTRPLAPPELAPATRARLLERFREPNAALSDLLGRDLSAWRI